jgi:hypothetical protein
MLTAFSPSKLMGSTGAATTSVSAGVELVDPEVDADGAPPGAEACVVGADEAAAVAPGELEADG